MNAGLRFGTACKKYFELLSDEIHTGMSVFDAAISLSLDCLQDCGEPDSTLTTLCNLREMYFRLCVLKTKRTFLSLFFAECEVFENPLLWRFASVSYQCLSPSYRSTVPRMKKKSAN